MKNSLIIALDFESKVETERFVDQFSDEQLFVKVGMELFYREGPSIVTWLKAKGHQVFLDLKLHDIPTTVQNALRNLAQLEVDLINVHAAGGSFMMEKALEGLEAGTPVGRKRPRLIAVTQLTSTSEQRMRSELLIDKPLEVVVSEYAKLSKKSGLDGVVCSPWEAAIIHEVCGQEFLTVTPGIRLLEDGNDDQERIATPSQAKKAGSDVIVVGRSITRASEPVQAFHKVKSEWMMTDE